MTPHHYPDCESLRETQMKLEIHLDNINQKTRGSIAATTSRIWRRISNLSSTSMRIRNNDNINDDFGYVRLKKVFFFCFIYLKIFMFSRFRLDIVGNTKMA